MRPAGATFRRAGQTGSTATPTECEHNDAHPTAGTRGAVPGDGRPRRDHHPRLPQRTGRGRRRVLRHCRPQPGRPQRDLDGGVGVAVRGAHRGHHRLGPGPPPRRAGTCDQRRHRAERRPRRRKTVLGSAAARTARLRPRPQNPRPRGGGGQPSRPRPRRRPARRDRRARPALRYHGLRPDPRQAALTHKPTAKDTLMPHPSTHLHARTGPHVGDPAWDEWSRAWTRHIPRLSGRSDLSVTVAPGAGGGAPACFYPDERRIEVDATHIGTPDVADPRRAGHKQHVPTAYGLLVHEASHAAHTRWHAPAGTPPVVADLLEESRAEHRQRARRRSDRRWLRHAVTTLLHPDDAPVDDPWHAGQVAGLLLARVDARIITSKDARAARTAVTAVLGRQRLRQLREIWRAAHTVDDTDANTMIELAWQWCRILGIDPTLHPHVPTADPGVFAGQLAAALTDYLAAAAGLTPAEYTARHIASRHAAPARWTRRDPTPDEHRAARHLAAQLRQARTRAPEPATRPSAIPPGRLRTRAAITAEAQIAAGTIPTAAPWQRRAHLPPHKPTLHLAVLVDVSGSMHTYAKPMSAAGWILAHAARRGEATTTTIAFGDTVTLLVPPGQRPTQVLEMAAWDSTENFVDAVKLADKLLGLRHHTTLRMLAVVSDGILVKDSDAAQQLITTLHRAGCAVLWLLPANLSGHTFHDTTTITVADPVEAIGHITHAAITALEHA